MNQLKGKNNYTSAIDCAVKIWRNEGFGSFYKGFTPFALTNTPWAIIFFLVFEYYKHKIIPIIVTE